MTYRRPVLLCRGRVRTPAAALLVGWLLVGCVLVGCLLVGCTATGSRAGSSAASSPPGTVTIGTVTHIESPTQTITRTVSGPDTTKSIASSPSAVSTPAAPSSPVSSSSPSSSATAATTPEPAAREASCPYLAGADLQLMSGERTGKVTVIDVPPQPICQFYRIVDGDWQVAVRVFQTVTPQAAMAAVDSRIPPAGSAPADQPAGWTGGYMSLPNGSGEFPRATSVYGVSKGDRAVVVWTNRATVRDRTIAEATIKALHW